MKLVVTGGGGSERCMLSIAGSDFHKNKRSTKAAAGATDSFAGAEEAASAAGAYSGRAHRSRSCGGASALDFAKFIDNDVNTGV